MITLGPTYEQMHARSACIVREGQLLIASSKKHNWKIRCNTRFSQFHPVHIAGADDRSSR
jgi:hypothetical protein